MNIILLHTPDCCAVTPLSVLLINFLLFIDSVTTCIPTHLHIFILHQYVFSWRDICNDIRQQAAGGRHGLQRAGGALLQPELRGTETGMCGVGLSV